jgi:hypothetical protein
MADPFGEYRGNMLAGAERAFSITPNDSADLATVTRGIFVGTTGNLKVLLVGDSDPVIFNGVAAGVVHSLRVKRVYAADTTASNLLGVY